MEVWGKIKCFDLARCGYGIYITIKIRTARSSQSVLKLRESLTFSIVSLIPGYSFYMMDIYLILLLNFGLVFANNKTEIFFSFITAMTGDSSSEGGVPIIDYALKEINNNSEILQNYTLNYKSVKDSKVILISGSFFF